MGATTSMRQRPAPSQAFEAARTAVVVVAGAASGLLFVLDPLGGTVLIALTERHGVDLGDLVVVPLVGAAVHVLSRRRRVVHRRSRLAATSTLAVGVLAAELLVLGGAALADGPEPRFDRATDAIVALGVVATAGWFVLSWQRSGRTHTSVSRLIAPLPVALFAIGLAFDIAMTPTGTVWSSTLVAAWASVAFKDTVASAMFGAAAVAGITANVASSADLVGVDVTMSASQGGSARAVALAILLFAALVVDLRSCR